MTDVAEIARGLTKAQRDALDNADKMNSTIYGPNVFVVSAGGATVAMCKKDLIANREFRSLTGRTRRAFALTKTGLAVRDYLKEQQG